MLKSEIRQSQSLAAFHFAMEAAVKNEQKNLKVQTYASYTILMAFLCESNSYS